MISLKTSIRRAVMSIAAAMMFAAVLTPVSAQTQNADFVYPTAPDSMTSLNDRCDYVITHFWESCDLQKAFSSKSKFRTAFVDWLRFMPYGTTGNIRRSVRDFIHRLEKMPSAQEYVGELAEECLYSDTGMFVSDQLYSEFAVNLARSKKLDRGLRERYARQAQILNATAENMPVPLLHYTDINGAEKTLGQDSSEVSLLFFNDPTCDECRMAGIRLMADGFTNRLIKQGYLKVYSILPDEPTDQWREQAATYPEEWEVGYAPDADEVFDLRKTPSIYILDENNHILGKNHPIDVVIQFVSNIFTQLQQTKDESAS